MEKTKNAKLLFLRCKKHFKNDRMRTKVFRENQTLHNYV